MRRSLTLGESSQALMMRTTVVPFLSRAGYTHTVFVKWSLKTKMYLQCQHARVSQARQVRPVLRSQ